MKKEKKYLLPESVRDAFMKQNVAEQCSIEAIKQLKDKKAFKFAKEAWDLKVSAWTMVREFYPELDDKELRFLWQTCEVIVIEDKEESTK